MIVRLSRPRLERSVAAPPALYEAVAGEHKHSRDFETAGFCVRFNPV